MSFSAAAAPCCCCCLTAERQQVVQQLPTQSIGEARPRSSRIVAGRPVEEGALRGACQCELSQPRCGRTRTP